MVEGENTRRVSTDNSTSCLSMTANLALINGVILQSVC